jgi:hypothetical protein
MPYLWLKKNDQYHSKTAWVVPSDGQSHGWMHSFNTWAMTHTCHQDLLYIKSLSGEVITYSRYGMTAWETQYKGINKWRITNVLITGLKRNYWALKKADQVNKHIFTYESPMLLTRKNR